jgi:hypothetical protein
VTLREHSATYETPRDWLIAVFDRWYPPVVSSAKLGCSRTRQSRKRAVQRPEADFEPAMPCGEQYRYRSWMGREICRLSSPSMTCTCSSHGVLPKSCRTRQPIMVGEEEREDSAPCRTSRLCCQRFQSGWSSSSCWSRAGACGRGWTSADQRGAVGLPARSPW